MDDLRATAAEAARVTAIENRCPTYVVIDVGFTRILQGAILMDGIRRIVKTEQARIDAEIEAAGMVPSAEGVARKALSGRVPAMSGRFVLRRSESPSKTSV